jgi:hypothetical protein
MILALLESTGTDQTLRNACNDALWHVDARGELHGYHTASGDLVRAAVMARVRTPLPHAHVIVTTVHSNGWRYREPQVWVSYARCLSSLDPFQNGAHTQYGAPGAPDLATEIARWRSQNGG